MNFAIYIFQFIIRLNNLNDSFELNHFNKFVHKIVIEKFIVLPNRLKIRSDFQIRSFVPLPALCYTAPELL